MTDIDQQAGISVTMFFHFFDETTVLPMGTIQPFSRSGDNRLYVYNSPGLLNDSNDPPPTVRDLLSLSHKINRYFIVFVGISSTFMLPGTKSYWKSE